MATDPTVQPGAPAASPPVAEPTPAAPVVQPGAPAATPPAPAAPAPPATPAATPGAPAAQPPVAEPTPAAPTVQPGTPAPAAAAPITLTLPENTHLDASDVAAVTELAKAHGLTSEQAQAALVEMHTELEATRTRLDTELRAHPEVGGDHLAAAQLNATRALDRFLPQGSTERSTLDAFLAKSGYGSYAPVVVLLSRIGAAMGEDTPIARGGAPAAEKKSLADRIFG